MATLINSLGLLFDIVGALLLLKYGLPPRIDPEGHIHIIAESVDEAEIAQGKIYRFWSNVAVVLLIIGFMGQLASNFIN